MLWFGKRRRHQNAQTVADTVETAVSQHKEVKQEAVQESKRVNAQLNRVLCANGFTLKIYLAAGGKQPKTHRGAV